MKRVVSGQVAAAGLAAIVSAAELALAAYAAAVAVEELFWKHLLVFEPEIALVLVPTVVAAAAAAVLARSDSEKWVSLH